MNFWPKNRFFPKNSFMCFDICFRNFQPFEPKIVVCDPETHSNTFLKFLDRWTEFDSFEINVLLVQGVICMFCMDFSGYCRDFSRFLKNLANLQNLHERNPWFWPPKKCHILLAARILRKIFPKFFFIHIISPKERFKNQTFGFLRHQWHCERAYPTLVGNSMLKYVWQHFCKSQKF